MTCAISRNKMKQCLPRGVCRGLVHSKLLLTFTGTLDKMVSLFVSLSQEHDLDFERLLDASAYKESYRADMIRWGEEKRNQDPGFFCRLATSGEDSGKDIWIICDARRLSDVQYFKNNYNSVTTLVRVHADLDARKQRGFVFTEGR